MTSKFQFVGEKVKLGDFISASGERNKSLCCTDVYSVTNSLGFTPSAEYFSKEVFSKDLKTYRVVRRGMIAYNPSRINVGSVALQDKRSEVIVSPLYVVFGVDEGRLLPEFLLRFLKSRRGLEQIASSSTGTVRNNLKFNALCDMEICLPSLACQRECVDRLKAISNQISSLDLILGRLDQLVKSRFVEMFGDGSAFKKCNMSQLVKGIVSGTNIGGNQRLLGPGEFAVLRISAVTKGWFNSAEYKVVDDVSSIDMIHPRKGDLLFSRANTSEMVGATAIVDKDYENLFLPDKLWRLDLADDVDTVFVKYLLSTQAVRKEMSKVATGSSGSMQNISMAKFRKLKAFLPPFALQQQFADFVAQVDKPRFVAQQQIEKLQMLYDSLAQDYFG